MDYDTHRRIAEEAYNDDAEQRIGDYELVHSTPTLKAYRHLRDDDMIVGVRGTYDMRDVKTDAALAAGRLRYTQRFKDDSDNLKQLLNRYHGDVSTASHSLGSAIAEELGKDYGRIKGGVAFNPAYDAKQLYNRGSKDVTRYYAKGDFLSKLGGKRLHNVKWVDPGAKDPIEAHGLHNFVL